MEARQNLMIGEVRPIENHVILELIFEHCTVQDLKICRQVSTLWRNISLKAWRSSAVLNILASFAENITRGVVYQQFLEFVRDEDNMYFKQPFSKYAIYKGIDPTFYTRFGSHIKFLKLCDYKLLSRTDLSQMVADLCPNLEEFVLQNVFTSADVPFLHKDILNGRNRLDPQKFQGHENYVLTSLMIIEDNVIYFPSPFSTSVSQMELLSRCPNLKVFSYQGSSSISEELFSTIATIRRYNPNKFKLEIISTDVKPPITGNYPSPNALHVLLDPFLKLKKVSLQINGPKGAQYLRAILRQHNNSLKSLCIYPVFPGGNGAALNPNEIFGERLRLENLKALVLHANVLLNMKILKFTPNLESLELVGGFSEAINKTSNLDLYGMSLLSVRDLKLKNSILGVRQLMKFGEWMPFVESLKITCLNNKSFSAVCESWPYLVNLEIVKSLVNDEGITGYDLEDVKRINEERENGSWRPITAPRANITNLTGLRSFSMNPYSEQYSFMLGYCAAVYGFKQLRRLDNLKLNNYKHGPVLHT